MMTSGKRINGRFFSSGAVRYTRRFFIDGKRVSKAVFAAEVAAAKKAERAEADALASGPGGLVAAIRA